MPIKKPKRILVAPLDWGLGHTARCIPIIRCIARLGHVPVFAGNDWQRAFIKETFGSIENIHLGGYNVTYSKWNRWLQAGLIAQLPRLLNTIRAEQAWLTENRQALAIDGVISDNRYGLHSADVPSVIITHQLRIRTGAGSLADSAVQRLHYKYLDKYTATWVPDAPGSDNLGGALSHTLLLPQRIEYIGLLSQFDAGAGQAAAGGHLLILLSGPEPQRSISEQALWRQCLAHSGKVVFVAGSAAAVPPLNIPAHITYYKLLPAHALGPLLQGADMVVCRSGYSTLMDLVRLGKKAILIPTPWQTEQEYLARRLKAEGCFYSHPQRGFSLAAALQAADNFRYRAAGLQGTYRLHEKVAEDWVAKLP